MQHEYLLHMNEPHRRRSGTTLTALRDRLSETPPPRDTRGRAVREAAAPPEVRVRPEVKKRKRRDVAARGMEWWNSERVQKRSAESEDFENIADNVDQDHMMRPRDRKRFRRDTSGLHGGRQQRSVGDSYYNAPPPAPSHVKQRRKRTTCSRHELYVDFDEIGWSGWIISPRGYNAFHCRGECPFPLGQNQRPTNHATVQSIVHALRIGKGAVGTPCCVPNKLYSISLLYFDDDENVILKQYDDMVAASCGCH